MFYSKSTSGFYSTDIHGTNMPSDVVEITHEEHAALLLQQTEGADISGDENGYPVAILPPVPTQEQIIAAASEKVRRALQLAIDDKAKELGFSGGNALMLYAGFVNAFQSMASQFATWEASVWVEAGAYKDEVLAGNQPMLTGEQAVAMMPVYPL